MTQDISAPEKLSDKHDFIDFDSDEPILDDCLRNRAKHNEACGVSRTYVVCYGDKIIGYYTLAVGAVTHMEARNRIKRNMPNPIPVMVLGRLAVDKRFQGQGIGKGLLKDAILRTLKAGELAGIRAMLVHAISDKAKEFYIRYGCIPSPVDPLTVMITLADAFEIISPKV